MKAENLITQPIKTTYKLGVYGSFGIICVSLAGFILWSFTCIGGACWQLLS